MAFDYLSTEKPTELDITDWKEKGDALKTAIENAVKDTQRVIIRALPNRIKMTQAQYNDLTSNLITMNHPDDPPSQEYFLYRTPKNIMEVEVVDTH